MLGTSKRIMTTHSITHVQIYHAMQTCNKYSSEVATMMMIILIVVLLMVTKRDPSAGSANVVEFFCMRKAERGSERRHRHGAIRKIRILPIYKPFRVYIVQVLK